MFISFAEPSPKSLVSQGLLDLSSICPLSLRAPQWQSLHVRFFLILRISKFDFSLLRYCYFETRGEKVKEISQKKWMTLSFHYSDWQISGMCTMYIIHCHHHGLLINNKDAGRYQLQDRSKQEAFGQKRSLARKISERANVEKKRSHCILLWLSNRGVNVLWEDTAPTQRCKKQLAWLAQSC